MGVTKKLDMKLILLSSVLIAYISNNFINLKGFTNNVCKSFEDYYTDRDNNENCYHNPDHELTVVSLCLFSVYIYILFCKIIKIN